MVVFLNRIVNFLEIETVLFQNNCILLIKNIKYFLLKCHLPTISADLHAMITVLMSRKANYIISII